MQLEQTVHKQLGAMAATAAMTAQAYSTRHNNRGRAGGEHTRKVGWGGWVRPGV